MVKVRFPHPLAGAPLVGLQFTIPPFPQNGTRRTGGHTNVGGSVSMRLIADTSDWDKTQHGIALRRIRHSVQARIGTINLPTGAPSRHASFLLAKRPLQTRRRRRRYLNQPSSGWDQSESQPLSEPSCATVTISRSLLLPVLTLSGRAELVP